MSGLRARVEKGRLVLDAPTTRRTGQLSTWWSTTKAMTSPKRSVALCTKRCLPPGHRLRPAAFAQRRRSWTNCARAGEPAGPNHSRRRHTDPRYRRLLFLDVLSSSVQSFDILLSLKGRGFLRSRMLVRSLRWVPPTTALLQRRTTKRLYFRAVRP